MKNYYRRPMQFPDISAYQFCCLDEGVFIK